MITKLDSGRLSLSIKDLPAVPELAADALRVLDGPSSSMAEIEAVVMRDQSMAVKTLRIVNSAAYGFSRRIETIREAVTIMGVRKMRGLAGAVVSARFFARPIEGIVEPRDLWAHSLAASVWAMEIIDMMRRWQAQSAVMAALLHDIGIVVLCEHEPVRYREILEMSRTEGLHHVDVEQREFDTTHAFIGAALCAKWLLPVGLTQLVSHHHLTRCPDDDALAVLMLADYLAHDCGIKPFKWSATPALPEGLLEKMGIDDFVFKSLQERSDVVHDRASALYEASMND